VMLVSEQSVRQDFGNEGKQEGDLRARRTRAILFRYCQGRIE